LFGGASAALLTLLVVNAVWAAEPAWGNHARPVQQADHRSIGRALATVVRGLVGQRHDAVTPTSWCVAPLERPLGRLAASVDDTPVVTPPREALIDLPPPTR